MILRIDGETIDSIDLKALLVSRGIKVSGRVYSKYKNEYRLSPDPLECNCMLRPDNTIVHLTDLALHMRYIKSAVSWDTSCNRQKSRKRKYQR